MERICRMFHSRASRRSRRRISPSKAGNFHWSTRRTTSRSRAVMSPEVTVKSSDVVFVGYGVVAPEYGWDDYKDVDVKGKTILMLINDPAIPDPNDPSKLDDKMFKGRAMTYYGRWTYKYEIASQKGAAAAIIIHETGPAGLSLRGGLRKLGRREFRHPASGQQHGPRSRGRLDHLRQSERALPHGRPRSGGAEEGRYSERLQAGRRFRERRPASKSRTRCARSTPTMWWRSWKAATRH